jgi:hypothetical protein
MGNKLFILAEIAMMRQEMGDNELEKEDMVCLSYIFKISQGNKKF